MSETATPDAPDVDDVDAIPQTGEDSESTGGTEGRDSHDGEPGYESESDIEDASVLPHVGTASTIISGCSENEVKNFVATADFISREIVVTLAEQWEEIARKARKGINVNGSGAVALTASVKLDLTSILLLDVKFKMGFSSKVERKASTEQDLAQTNFVLGD